MTDTPVEPPRSHNRRSWLVATGAVAVLVVAAFIPQLGGRLWTNGYLRESGSAGFCYQPPTDADWNAVSTYGIRGGPVGLTLSSNSARVTVTDIEPIDPTPGIEVLETAMVPTGAIGFGAWGYQPWPVSNAGLLPLVERLPAHLKPMPAAAKLVGLSSAARDWTIAVLVRVPAYSVKASIAGFRITYKTGLLTKTIRSKDSFVIGMRC